MVDLLHRPAGITRLASLTNRTANSLHEQELRAMTLLQRFSMPAMRISLGVIFVWFGGLKAAGVSPVADLVAGTMPFLDRTWFVPALGVFEIVLGLGLLSGRFLRLVLPVLIAHLAGTFLVLVMEPALAFQHGDPLLLSTIGEFVVKNLILITAVMVIAARQLADQPRTSG